VPAAKSRGLSAWRCGRGAQAFGFGPQTLDLGTRCKGWSAKSAAGERQVSASGYTLLTAIGYIRERPELTTDALSSVTSRCKGIRKRRCL